MKIALTGTTGIGKTTLARALAERLSIPIINEDFEPLINSLAAFDRNADAAKVAQLIVEFLQNCDGWLKKRVTNHANFKSFVEDRFGFDIVRLIMTSSIGVARPDVLRQLLDLCSKQSVIYDLVIVPPLSNFSFMESKNEYGLTRKTNYCDKLRYQTMTVGLLEHYCSAPKLYIHPSCETTEQRVEYVLDVLEKLKIEKQSSAD
jgi:hypothetical protein